MSAEPAAPIAACRDAMRLQVRVVKMHGPEYHARYQQMQFSVAVQMQNGKAGPQKRTALAQCRKVESWTEATWDQDLQFDNVSWLAEQKTLPLLRFKIYGHRRGESSKKSAAVWSTAVSCANFFRFPGQSATLMLERRGGGSSPDTTSSFDNTSLQVEVCATPLDSGGRQAPAAHAMIPSSGSSLPLNFQRDSLFVAVRGVKKLQHDTMSDHQFQAQAELRVGADGPFEVSRIVSLKKGSRTANLHQTFMLPYHNSARIFTPVLTVNVNVFVGSSENNVTVGSFCAEIPIFPLFLSGQHVVGDWFPLHRHNSNTGNVKGYVFVELQHCFHSSFQQPAQEGIYFRVVEATQLNLAPTLGQSSLHVEALGTGSGSAAAANSAISRTMSQRKRGSSAVWNEVILVPVPDMASCAAATVAFRLCNANRFDDIDCQIGLATAEINLDRHRGANAMGDAGVVDTSEQSTGALGRELLDLVILDSAENSRGTLRCEVLGLAGHVSPQDVQLVDTPDTREVQHSGFDGALYLQIQGVRYLERLMKHAKVVVAPAQLGSSNVSNVASSPMARSRGRGRLQSDVPEVGSHSQQSGSASQLQVKERPLRRGSFFMIPVHSARLPSIVRVQIVEHQEDTRDDDDDDDGGGQNGDGVSQVPVRELHLPIQWFTDGSTSADWFSLSGARQDQAVPPMGWGQLQLSGTWIPSAAGNLTIKVLSATGLPERSMVDEEDVFVRFDVGKRTFKTSLSPQGGGGTARWDEAQRFQYSLWRDSFDCEFSLLRDTNLQDNFLGSRSLPVHVLLGMGGRGHGQTIYGEHQIVLLPSDFLSAGASSLLDFGASQPMGGGSSEGPVLKIQSTFVPSASVDSFTDAQQATAAETFALKRLFYGLDRQRTFVLNRAQLCDAAAPIGHLTLSPFRLQKLESQDKMITWSEWANFLAGFDDAASRSTSTPSGHAFTATSDRMLHESKEQSSAIVAAAPPRGSATQSSRVFASITSDPSLANSSNRLVNILASELQRLREELDKKDSRIRELEAGKVSGKAGSSGGGSRIQASKFDFVRAGANNLRHMKAQRQSGGDTTGRTSGTRSSRSHKRGKKGKKASSSSSSAAAASESEAVRKLQRKNEQLKTQLHLEKTRSLATDSNLVDHRINTDSAHMIKLMQHDHRLQIQSLEATNAELNRKLDRREQKYQRVLATQKMMEQKVLQKQRKVQSLEKEVEMLRVQLQGSTWRQAMANATTGLDATEALLSGTSAELERTVQARLDEQARRRKRSAEEEARAAVAIQNRFRGHRANQERHRHASATKIQAQYRRHHYAKAGGMVAGFDVGTRVLANFNGKAMRFGTITGTGGGGGRGSEDLYTVQYDHGPVERNVPSTWIKAIGEEEDPRAAELRAQQQAIDDATGQGGDFGTADDFVGGVDVGSWTPEVGDHIEFVKDYQVDGSVVAHSVNGAGDAATVGIGEVLSKNRTTGELRVALLGEEVVPLDKREVTMQIQLARPHVRRYVEGDRVCVRYQGHPQWFDGAVTKECGNGRYNILYDDGNREFDAAAVFMKPAAKKEEVDLRTLLAPGLVVEARYGGGPEWYRGTVQLVSGIRGEERCNIKYDDGDVEEEVPLVLIRLPNDGIDGVEGADGPGADGDYTAQDKDNDSLLKRLFHGLTDDEIKALLKTPWNSPKEKREVLKTIAMLPLKQKKAVCRLFMSEDSESRANRLEYVREFVRQQSELRRRERAARKIQKGVRTRRASQALTKGQLEARREAAAIMVQRNYRNARNYKKCSYKQNKDSALKIQRYYRARAQKKANKKGKGAEEEEEVDAEDSKTEEELNLELLTAIQSNQGVQVCERIIMAHADVNARDIGDDGVTFLYAATEVASNSKGDETADGTEALTVMSMLLKFKASPNVCSRNGCAPLHVAAAFGSDDAVKVLMRDAAAEAGVVAGVAMQVFAHRNSNTAASVGCDINIVNPQTHQTPLGVAAEKGHEAVIRLLLDAGGVVDENTPAFHNGDTVEAKFQGGEHYFPGRVQAAYVDNTFDILYDDGDAEKRVPSSLIRAYAPSDNEDDTFVEGDVVMANYKGDGQWYRGTVRRVNLAGSIGGGGESSTAGDMTNYDIEFTDGTIQKHVPADCVKEAPAADGAVFAIGDLVSAMYRQGNAFFDGVIGHVHDDGTYLVEYEDGDVEDFVQAKYIRLRVPHDLYYILGEKVEVQQADPTSWLPATVADTHDENRYYTVLYDGGDRMDIQIPSKRLRRGVAPALKEKVALRVDDQVEANFNSEGSWYPGRIIRVHAVEGGGIGGMPDFEYDIQYDDGDAEDRKPASEVRLIPRYKMGQHVEARYRGGNDWFPAKIVGVTSFNKYHLEFEDGAGEQDILYSAIREALKFKIGDKIQAQFRGLVEYFDGEIAEANLQEHTYTINYTDGDVEYDVIEGLIRFPPAQEGFMPSEDVQVRLVHAGQRKWVAGKVIRMSTTGSNDYYIRAVMPDDGSHKIVLASIDDIRYPLDQDFVFEVGQRVEARFKMGMIYFAGSITKQHDDDGSYDIQYDDGDVEYRVAPDMIRKLRVNDFDGVFWHRVDDIFAAIDRGGDGRVTQADFATYCSRLGDLPGPDDAGVGAATKEYWADFQRRKQDSGTFTDKSGFRQFFDFVSGSSPEAPEKNERCQAVCRYLSQGVHLDDQAKETLMPGSRIEARYGGFHEWFPGRIVARASEPGTFHIAYDDGDHEDNVPANLIRLYEESESEDEEDDEDSDDEGNSEEESPVERGATAHARGAPVASRRVRELFEAIDSTLADKDGQLSTSELKAAIDDQDVQLILFSNLDSFNATFGREADDSIGAEEWDRFFDFVARTDLQRQGEDVDPAKPVPLTQSSTAMQLLELLESYVGSRGTGVGAVSGSSTFKVGQAVEARFAGQGEWFPGVIAKVSGANAYDVQYDDGDFEGDVDASLIRLAPLAAGDRVEGNFAQAGEWFPGKVDRVNADGTYDLIYDDGDVESSVAPSLVRALPAEEDAESQASGASGEAGQRYGVGESVEGNFGGQGTWFSGKISHVNPDGTYDLIYDDGDAEKGVRAKFIRNVDTFDADSQSTMTRANGLPSTASWAVGDRVEGNFASQGSWFPGRISKINPDGTFDIRYDDGDFEAELAKHLVRRPGVETGDMVSDPSGSVGFQVGDKVEADYAGEGTYFPGQVAAIRSDGTLDIAYDDGDAEQEVPATRVRLLDSKAPREVTAASSTDEAAKSAVGSPPTTFSVGDSIEGNFAAQGSWFPGKIGAVNADGTFNIDYADGDAEESVPAHLIRRRGLEGAGAGHVGDRPFLVGDVVDANFGGEGSFFPGRITAQNADGTFDIAYDDGDTEEGVAAEMIRAAKATEPGTESSAGSNGDPFDVDSQSTNKIVYAEGDKVQADYAGAGSYYDGTVAKVNGDGTYDILYEDGDSEQGVTADHLRLVERADATQARSNVSVVSGNGGSLFETGTLVEADFGGEGAFFPGKISHCNPDGTYDVAYDDGDAEQAVPVSRLRKRASAPAAETATLASAAAFRKGDAVDADFAGEGTYFGGIISAVNPDGTFNIAYDDGDAEEDVPLSRIRSKNSGGGGGGGSTAAAANDSDNGGFDADSQSTSAAAAKIFAVGDPIEANYAGEGSFFPGKIGAKNSDGTYDVAYDDGDEEKAVPAHRIRKAENIDQNDFDEASVDHNDGGGGGGGGSSGGSAAQARKFGVGDPIEADFNGEGSHFPGKISKINEDDGTYDIVYDDGDTEKAVPENRIRSPESSTGGNTGSNTFKEGELIEANYAGEGTYFPGKIAKVFDRSYDIVYDDGDEERGVDEKLIRRRGASQGEDAGSVASEELGEGDTPLGAGPKFKKGDKIEADYGQEGTYFPGYVERVNSDGTYDITYEDGDAEDGVQENLIRERSNDGTSATGASASAGGGGSSAQPKFKKGDPIEANYGEEGTFFPGKIDSVNADGTYDIAYDDGDAETGVAEDLIRAQSNATADSGPSTSVAETTKFKVGDAVEALYNGGDEWYAGKIDRDNGNGTYAITYDDGDREEDVPEDEIRAKGASGGTSAGRWKLKDRVLATADGTEWRPGVVNEVTDDGGYLIQFDDGDDLTVDSRDIKSLQGSGDNGGSQDDGESVAEGDTVQAYDFEADEMKEAEIVANNGDGTFHVKFLHDGHEDKAVDRNDIE